MGDTFLPWYQLIIQVGVGELDVLGTVIRV